jgi:hypothetical protein
MARITGPLFSLTARGAVGHSIAFSSSNGTPYVKRRSTPRNPRSQSQTAVRDTVATLSSLWAAMPPRGQAPWTEPPRETIVSGRNRFLQLNIPLLKNSPDMTPFRATPGSSTAASPLGFTAITAPVRQVGMTFVQPALPPGWTQTAVAGLALLNSSPSPPVSLLPTVAVNLAAPFLTIVFTVPITGTYILRGWNRFTDPVGDIRHSNDRAFLLTVPA